MSRQGELNLYLRQVQQRFRLSAGLLGAAVLMAAALVTTLVLVIILNAYAFPARGLSGARVALLVVLGLTGGLALVWPVLRLNRRRSVAAAEAARPELEQRLTTFSEKQAEGNDPFIELLAADTLGIARQDAAPAALIPQGRLLTLAGVGVGCLAVLLWMIAAGPGFVGYGASLLWTGPKHDAAPLYDIKVLPGDIAVRRHSDQVITAEVIGLKTDKVRLFAKYDAAGSDKSAGWEPVAMQAVKGLTGFVPVDAGEARRGSNFQFVFSGLPESVEYYVEAGPVTSKHYKVRVVDLPSVKEMHVTYHYPAWTGLKQVSEEHGGDLRAIEGTEAEIEVVMDRPLKDSVLALDGGQQLKMTGGEGNVYHGTIKMEKDGAYHVAAVDQGQQVRLSEDYFIATNKALPPEIRIDRPGGDYRASPIEEVTVGVSAGDEFGLREVELHYSVNGGPEQKVNVLKQTGAKNADGTTTLRLEDFKLVPGDLVSLYATARDGHQEAKTQISFIQADPFEREFSQSQSGGGGGGGGGGGQQGNQTDISKREKELIAATWKQVNGEDQNGDKQTNKAAAAKEAADQGKFLSDVQTKLREQSLALSGRMQSRDLATANEEFTAFEKDMQEASKAMVPAAEKLKAMQWKDALPIEQKVLQNLLRAEATFRQIQVAFNQQRGGGGGGGGSAGRDLASLFDLELDTEKNQYETAQTASPAEQKAKEVDDALAKLDALAKRQEELAAQKQPNATQSFEQRWQQEMLRREAERLEKQMEQMAQNQQGQQGQQGQSGQQGQQGGQQSSSGQGGQSGQSGGQQGSQGQAGGSQSASGQPGGKQGQQQGGKAGQSGQSDPRVTQALNRLRQADEAMKQGAAQGQQQNGQQSAEAAKRAAEALRQAESLLSGTQQQQASGTLDSLTREAGRLGGEEKAQAERIRTLAGASGDGATSPEQLRSRIAERDRLVNERQQLSDDLSKLERGMRDTARSLAPNQPNAASKLRDALNGMDQSDLGNQVQRSADLMRRGYDPNSNGTESAIGTGLQKLNDQLREAQQGMGAGKPIPGQGRGQGRDQGEQTAALDHVDRLRNQLQSLTGQGVQRGQGQGQGQQPGQQSSGQGRPGQQGQQGQGQQQGQGGQRGQGQQQGQGGGQGQQQGQGQQGGQGGQQGNGGQRGGSVARGGDIGGGRQQSGDIGGQRGGGGGTGTIDYNLDTGGQQFDQSGKRVIDGPQNRATDGGITQREQAYRAGMTELNQLKQLAKNDPGALKEVDDLVKQMQQLDPNRFVGNPAMVEQLHTEVLSGVDKLELQLRRGNEEQPGQVRTGKPVAVPPGYQDAVADYYRRLSNGNKAK